ncbi:MAG: hypothetical protein WA446_13515 [Steroidobacteraceae bacterium]
MQSILNILEYRQIPILVPGDCGHRALTAKQADLLLVTGADLELHHPRSKLLPPRMTEIQTAMESRSIASA